MAMTALWALTPTDASPQDEATGLGFDENFTVAYDFATSYKTSMQVYTGLGYLC